MTDYEGKIMKNIPKKPNALGHQIKNLNNKIKELKAMEEKLSALKECQIKIIKYFETIIADIKDPKMKHRLEKMKNILERIASHSSIDTYSKEDDIELDVRQREMLEAYNLKVKSPHIEKLIEILNDESKVKNAGKETEAAINFEKELIKVYEAIAVDEENPIIRKNHKKMLQIMKRIMLRPSINSIGPKKFIKRFNKEYDDSEKIFNEICKIEEQNIFQSNTSISNDDSGSIEQKISSIKEHQKDIIKKYEDRIVCISAPTERLFRSPANADSGLSRTPILVLVEH